VSVTVLGRGGSGHGRHATVAASLWPAAGSMQAGSSERAAQ